MGVIQEDGEEIDKISLGPQEKYIFLHLAFIIYLSYGGFLIASDFLSCVLQRGYKSAR